MTVDLYDPLTYNNLMMGLIAQFEKMERFCLDSEDLVRAIEGPGIYSLYYLGDNHNYVFISDGFLPIYVGKAIPPGSRKGDSMDPYAPALRRRIIEHSKSINQAENLDLSDFFFRYLAVEPVWITLAERFLIDNYQPVWNRCLEGFGDHDPGRGRHQGERSWWDTLHPGRRWADNLRTVKTEQAAADIVRKFFKERERL